MDFEFSERSQAIQAELRAFMADHVAPRDAEWTKTVEHDGIFPPPFIDELKAKARAAGLWNLFLPHLKPDEPGTRLSNLDYAPCAEIMGRYMWASEVFNCSAPDTGNMEVLHMFGTPEQKRDWLVPLMDGKIRSAFCMTEPDVLPRMRPMSATRSGARATNTSSTGANGSSPTPRTRAARS